VRVVCGTRVCLQLPLLLRYAWVAFVQQHVHLAGLTAAVTLFLAEMST
jgi:hypothetical protein